MLAATAESADALEVLLQSKAHVAAVDALGNSALFYAARRGRVAQAERLVAAGLDPKLRNAGGWSAVDYSVQSSRTLSPATWSSKAHSRRAGTVPALVWLKTGRPDSSLVGRRCLRRVAGRGAGRKSQRSGHAEVGPGAGRRPGSDDRGRPASAACRYRRVIARYRRGPACRWGLTDTPGSRGPHAAWRGRQPGQQGNRADPAGARRQPERAWRQHSAPITTAVRRGDADIVQMLLGHGAKVDTGKGDDAPLILATLRGDAATVSLLLRSGAGPEVTDATGHTALWHAACRDDTAVLALLLDVGANVMQPPRTASPLSPAPRRAATMRHSKSCCVRTPTCGRAVAPATRPDARARGNHAVIVRRLVALRVGLDAQNAFGDTALILAGQAGASDVVDLLLQAGAKKTLRNRDGVAAADAAAARGFDAVAARIRSS